MYDGSDPPLEDNLKTAVPLLELCRDNEIILEVETGVVGGGGRWAQSRVN